jgi:alpha-N-acetylglucosaminidase
MLPSSSTPRILLLAVVLACAASRVSCSGPRFAHLDRVRELQHGERPPPAEQVDAAAGLLARLLPSHSASFEFRVISTVRALCFSGILGFSLAVRGTGCE